MKRLLVIIFFTIFCASITTAQNFSIKDFKNLHWIIGSWRMPTLKSNLCEQWYLLDDSTLQSKGFILKAFGDTVLLETVQIALRGKKLYYIPTISGQNNNKPVQFIFTAATAQSFTAENPA